MECICDTTMEMLKGRHLPDANYIKFIDALCIQPELQQIDGTKLKSR